MLPFNVLYPFEENLETMYANSLQNAVEKVCIKIGKKSLPANILVFE